MYYPPLPDLPAQNSEVVKTSQWLFNGPDTYPSKPRRVAFILLYRLS